MSRILVPGRRPLLLPGTSKRAVRRPIGSGLIIPQPSAAPLSTDEIDYDELEILRQWREYSPDAPDEVRYFCYELEQLNPGATEPDRFFKAVRMIRLTRVPRYLRQQSTTEEFRDILSGLREKKILFLNIIAKSPKLPLVFAYGVQGVGTTLEEATDKADEAYAALTVSLDGSYQQLEYKPLSVTEGELLARYQNEWRHIAMARGRPLPENAGMGASAILDGNRTDVQQVNDAISSFIRGMGDKSFMMSMVTVPLTPEDMSHAWRNIAVKLSAVRSDQQGSRNVGVSFALPLGLGSSLGDTAGTTHGLTSSTGSGASDGLSASSTEGISVSHAEGASVSETQGVSVSETLGTSASETVGQSVSESQAFSVSANEGISASATEGSSGSFTEGVSESSSLSASDSVSRGVTDSISESTSVGQSVSQGQSVSTTLGTTDSISVSESASLTDTRSMSDTRSVSQGQSVGITNSASSNWGSSVSQGLSAGQTLTDNWSRSVSENLSQTWGLSESHNNGVGIGGSRGGSASIGGQLEALGLNATLGENWANNWGNDWGQGAGSSLSQTGGGSNTQGIGSSFANSLTNSLTLGESAGGSLGQSVSGTNSVTQGQSLTAGQSLGYGQTVGATQGTSVSSSATQGANYTQGASLSQGVTSGQAVNASVGQTLGSSIGTGASSAVTGGVSQAATAGVSQGAGVSASQGATVGASHASTVGASHAATQGASHAATQGASVTDTVGASASNTQGASTGVSSQQAVSDAWMVAMSRQAAQTGSFGIMPGMNASISKATFDEGKRALGDILEAQMRRYHDGIEGGGMLYQMFLVAEDRATLIGAATLLKAAFWGPGDSDKGRLVQPFHTIMVEDEEEANRLLVHAAALTHYRKREPVVDLIEPHAYSSYITAGEASVFSAPPTSEASGLMAQVDSMPVFAMPANRADRDMHLGHVVNGERGRVSDTRFGVDLNELTHILIQGTTGMGKTTTMMRLLEQAAGLKRDVVIPPTAENPTVQVKEARAGVLCFDWMENMRDLANVVEPERFQLFSISKPELGAFRWNPLEIPHPEMAAHQWLGSQADQLAASFGLGEVGRSLLAEYMERLYTANRLEPFVLREQAVDPDTGAILRREIVLPPVDRADLPPGAIQYDDAGNEVANVYTYSPLSRLVSLEHLATLVVSLVEELSTPEGARAHGTAMRDRVQSLWRRIQYYAPNGPLADMVKADPDLNTRECLGVSDIIDDERGLVTVIETDGLDQGNRRVVLGSVMLAIYRYGLHVGKGAFDNKGLGPGTFLIMEEAHELFGTMDEGEDRDSVSMRANLYESMFRRARATGLRLVAMTQNCGAIPPAITSQTTTVIVHRTYDNADRTRVRDLFSWDSTMVGQIRELRYLGEMPKGFALVRLNAQKSFLESAPVQILVDPPAIQAATDAQLQHLAQTRAERLA